MSSDNKIERLENQKVVADTISVPLSKEDLELLIDSLSDVSITNKQAISIFQKLNKGLEMLENSNEDR